MSIEITFILAAVVISWVMFVCNFVLGYYIGRAVEHSDEISQKTKPTEKNSTSFSPYLPFSLRTHYTTT